MSSVVINRKLERIIAGGKPRVLDLFSGCGGLSLGFHAAGAEIVGAIETDPVAIKSHSLNFHKHLSEAERKIHECPRDITTVEPCDLIREFGLKGRVDSQVDIIIGGPPCQSFARVGRAKLREVAKHPEAFLRDPRSNLYLRYLHYVRELRPVALLMENVPDVINYGGHNIAEEICEVLADMGYSAGYSILNAVFYGVPEMRERMFLIAYRNELDISVRHPDPTHWIDLPRGYHGSRQVALQTVKKDMFSDEYFYIDPPEPDKRLKPAVTAKDALSDLPKITKHLTSEVKRGARHFNDEIPYPDIKKLTEYQLAMRKWPGFESNGVLKDHVIRTLPRDYAIFARMHPGDQYPEAYAHALDLFKERLENYEVNNGKSPRKGSKVYEQIKKNTVPPYSPDKFPNKWRKMEADKPARTLMAHLGKDTYSHIHYDSKQARTISVREAARLQSFPDGFVFEGPMNPAFRQIGNAVPPLMAKSVAEMILSQLKGESIESNETCLEAINCV